MHQLGKNCYQKPGSTLMFSTRYRVDRSFTDKKIKIEKSLHHGKTLVNSSRRLETEIS